MECGDHILAVVLLNVSISQDRKPIETTTGFTASDCVSEPIDPMTILVLERRFLLWIRFQSDDPPRES